MTEITSLKSQTKRGLYWSAAKNIANRGVQFIFGLIMARLLSPDAYGVIGIIMVFTGIIGIFIDCGFSEALIRKPNRTQVDFSTEFFFNIGVGLFCYLILFIAAPYIADFYDMPILLPTIRVVALGIIINSLCVVQGAQFAINLDFKTPAKLSVSTNLFSGVIGIVLAYNGFGVWALVFQQIAGGVLNAMLLWILAGWRPTMEFSKESFHYLWGYGSKVLATSILQTLYDNLYPIIIGKCYSARSLGLYARAQGFASLPSTNISGILGSVTFPVLCKMSDDFPRLIGIYRRMIKTAAFIVFPMMCGLGAISSPLVKVLLNQQWYECIPILQLLCCALLWQPLSYIHLSVLKVAGRTDVIFKLEIVKRIVGVISIIASVPFGIIGMCIGYIFLYLFCFSLNTVYVSKVLKVPFISQVKDILPPFVISFIMYGIVYVLGKSVDSDLFALILGIPIGVIFYTIIAKIFMPDMLTDAISLVTRKKS